MQGRRILLTGFMGAGKTTAGRLLASRLGVTFEDLDDLVSAKARRTVPEIFATLGEGAFRSMEAECLQAWLTERPDCAVLALGGGAIESALVQNLLQTTRDAVVVHLKAPLDVLVQRCLADTGAARPLLSQAAERYHHRLPIYERLGNTLSVENLSPEQVVEAILAMLKDAR